MLLGGRPETLRSQSVFQGFYMSVLRLALCSSILLAGGCTAEELEALGFDVYFVKLDKSGNEVAGFTSELASSIGFEPIHGSSCVTLIW